MATAGSVNIFADLNAAGVKAGAAVARKEIGTIGDSMKSLKKTMGAESAFGQIAMMAKGGGALVGLTAAAGALKSLTAGAVEFRNQMEAANGNVGKLGETIIRSFPILGDLIADAGANINELITGDKSYLRRVEEEAEAADKRMKALIVSSQKMAKLAGRPTTAAEAEKQTAAFNAYRTSEADATQAHIFERMDMERTAAQQNARDVAEFRAQAERNLQKEVQRQYQLTLEFQAGSIEAMIAKLQGEMGGSSTFQATPFASIEQIGNGITGAGAALAAQQTGQQAVAWEQEQRKIAREDSKRLKEIATLLARLDIVKANLN